MTDPALAALTEALLDYMPPLPGPRFPLIDGEAQEVAATILAHPAMADLARKAAAWDAVAEALPQVVSVLRWYAHGPDTPTDIGLPARAVTPEVEVIAAALEQGG